MRARLAGILAGLALSAAILSCGGSEDGGNGPGKTLTVSPTSIAIPDCGLTQLNAAVKDGNGNPVSTTFTYTSDDPAIASVSPSGSVTGQGPGSTSITVAGGGLQKSIPVTISSAPDQIAVPDTVQVDQGGTTALGATVTDCHGDPSATALTYSPANGNIATVSAQGVLSGVGAGVTIVTVTAGLVTAPVTAEVFGNPSRTVNNPVVLTGSPFGVAISRAGVVYVTRIGTNTLGRGVVPVASFPSSITVGMTAAHVVFNPAGTRAYVTNQSDNSVSVVDVTASVEITQIPLGYSAFNLLVSPSGSTLFATVDVGNVYRINTATNAIADSFNVGTVPNGLAFSPDGSRLYISSRDAGWVVVYNTVTNTMIDTLVTGGMPQRMAVSRDGTELYIANELVGLDIWDLTSGTRITSLPMEGYGLALSPDNTTIYVSNPSTGTVQVVDRALRTSLGTITTGGTPRNIAFSRYGTEALIANAGDFVSVIR